MRTFLIIIGLFLFIGNSFAQSYEELIEKSYDFVDKGDLVSAEESLKAAMRKEPANPLNYALLTNLGTIQRRQGKLQEALISYTSALSGHTKNIRIPTPTNTIPEMIGTKRVPPKKDNTCGSSIL